MLTIQPISFPNLGITVYNLPKSIPVNDDVSLTLYGLIVGAAIILCFLITQWQARRTGQDGEIYIGIIIYAVIAALIGGRFVYLIESYRNFFDAAANMTSLANGGFSTAGAIVWGFIVMYFYGKFRKAKFLKLADTSIVGVITAEAVIRLGDFLNRENFGRYTNNVFAMRLSVEEVDQKAITPTMLAAAEKEGYVGFIQVHPLFLYAFVIGIALSVFLLVITPFRKFEGELFLIGLTGYLVQSCLCQSFTRSPLHIPGTPISMYQIIAVGLVALCVVFIIYGTGNTENATDRRKEYGKNKGKDTTGQYKA